MHKLVFNIRSATPSQVRTLSNHCRKRTRDRYNGYSEIDHSRTHLNEVLHGSDPSSLNKSLQAWYRDTKCQKPFQQSEKPYITIVMGASPEFFAEHGEAGTDAFRSHAMAWLKETFGDELVFAEIHLDETTPHIHAMVAPTFSKKVRVPGRKKRGETDEEFEIRKEEARASTGARTVGRSHSRWAYNDSYDDLRMSASKALEPLGIYYGEVRREGASAQTTRDFVKSQKVALDRRAQELEAREQHLEAVSDKLKQLRGQLVEGHNALAERVQKLNDRDAQAKEILSRKRDELAVAAADIQDALYEANGARSAFAHLETRFDRILAIIRPSIPEPVFRRLADFLDDIREALGLSVERAARSQEKVQKVDRGLKGFGR